MKVAIIGAGPRGLWAAQELVAQLRTAPESTTETTTGTDTATVTEIVVFDPYPPGAGAVYRTDQPRQWRLNVRSSVIDCGSIPLDQWRERNLSRTGETLPLDPFPPRALVGEYLRDCWDELISTLPAHVRIEYCPRRVRSVAKDDPAQDGSGFRVEGRHFDHVLVATGHEHDHPGALIHAPRSADAPPITPLYWGADLPERPRIVGVRGAALTFIDVCLTYGDVAEAIYPVNRSGRFMEVKPDPSLPAPDLSRFAPAMRAAATTSEIEDILARVARELLGDATRGDATRDDEIRAVLAGTDFTGDAVAELRTSLAVAEGAAPPTPASAVGAAFLGLYQDIVDAMAIRGEPLPGFMELARRLERVAFGPPPATARMLLELIDRGEVDTRFLGSPDVLAAWLAGREVGGVFPDVLIDATIAPQGQPHPFADVDGVVAVGRTNEHRVVGHDSLKRTVHRDIPDWAARVAKYAAESAHTHDAAAEKN